MKDLVKYVGVGLAALLLAACQTTDKKGAEEVKVGILQYVEHESLTAARKGFEAELEAAGYQVTWDYQNAQADQAQLQTLSESLVGDNDLVLAIATPAAQALATATVDTPVLFTAVTDPVAAGLVADLAQPDGLLTGTSDQSPIDKQVDLIGQALPEAKTVGILYTTSETNSEIQVKEAQKALDAAGYKVVVSGISSSNEVQDATSKLMGQVDVVFVPTDNTIASTMALVGELSVEKQVPVIGGSTDMVDVGGLLTYGTDYKALGAQTARQAVKLLSGKKTADVAVELPQDLTLHINQDMAKKLGLDLSTLSVD